MEEASSVSDQLLRTVYDLEREEGLAEKGQVLRPPEDDLYDPLLRV